ncbi:MAG: sodium:proton antiporter NhaD [Chloroflexi bacterium]|nr:sodium:proton antiporter NhaD [Chloroflexota bacterium]
MTLLITIIFILGYLAIAFEHRLKVDKAAPALVAGVLCWTVYILSAADAHLVNEQLGEHLGEISGILFFLIGAMTIVELIDVHDGFEVITSKIVTTDKIKLLWLIGFITFFLSAILDNLTTTIVIVSLLRKLIADKQERWIFAGVAVIAANAGGAWSPIGDVTTTMLWIGNRITSEKIIPILIIPSIVSLALPLWLLSFRTKGNINKSNVEEFSKSTVSSFERNFVFFAGVLAFVLVPVFKTLTHLPPFMGILLALGALWIVTEVIHGQKDETERHKYSVALALRRIDTPSVLFFLGILTSVGALQSTGQLAQFAQFLNESIRNENVVVFSLGLLSAIVDNVPLVAATMGMYSLQQYPTDHSFWQFLAYATGTGGSALIIGSAAGVAAMGIEKISFFWYLKKMSWLALVGYFAGALFYLLQNFILGR